MILYRLVTSIYFSHNTYTDMHIYAPQQIPKPDTVNIVNIVNIVRNTIHSPMFNSKPDKMQELALTKTVLASPVAA